MNKIKQIFEGSMKILKNKTAYKRLIILVALILLFAWIILGDQYCKTKYFECNDPGIKLKGK